MIPLPAPAAIDTAPPSLSVQRLSTLLADLLPPHYPLPEAHLSSHIRLRHQYLPPTDQEPDRWISLGGQSSTIAGSSFSEDALSHDLRQFALDLELRGVQIEDDSSSSPSTDEWFVQLMESLTYRQIDEETFVCNVQLSDELQLVLAFEEGDWVIYNTRKHVEDDSGNELIHLKTPQQARDDFTRQRGTSGSELLEVENYWKEFDNAQESSTTESTFSGAAQMVQVNADAEEDDYWGGYDSEEGGKVAQADSSEAPPLNMAASTSAIATQSLSRESETVPSIPLYVSNGKAYCWDAQDLANLRVKHHISGLNAGTLPGVAQQNIFLGLPSLLMQEEVVALVEDGICHLVHSNRALRLPSASEIERHTAARCDDIRAMQQEQLAINEEKRRLHEQKAQGKADVRKKREERKKAKKETEGIQDETHFAPSNDATQSKEVKPDTAASSVAFFSIIPATSTSHPWFDPSGQNAVYRDLESARKAGIWSYPSNQLERARCMSFRRLWEKGMFLGQGVKFGGEFLVYPGDPMRYHSHFVNTTIPSDDTVIRPLELVAWGRLGTATKKSHLLCCYDEKEGDEGKLEFYSLEWGNFG